MESTLNATSNNSPNYSESKTLGNEPPFSEEPQGLKVFRFFIYAVIIALALVGNVAVCVISRRNRRLQTSTYCLVMNLAVSDIGSVLCLPFLLPELFVGNWMMGEVMCKLLKPSVVLFNFVTTNTLVAIGCDRFRAVVYPLVPRPSTSETRLIVSILWLIAFVFSLPSYGAMTVRNFPDDPNSFFCVDVFSDNTETDTFYRRVYTVTMYIVQALSPVLIISVLYLKITATLKHIRLIPLALRPTRSWSLGSTPSASPRSSVACLNKLNMNASGFLKRQLMEKKFLRMLMTVLLVYVLCYLPFQTMYLVYEFHPTLFTGPYMQPLSEFLYLLVWLPNALNPVCYGCLNDYYKRAFKALIFQPRKFIQSLRVRQSFSHSVVVTTLTKRQR
ncbi:neuropeptide FF receptor 2-like isoform X2 [Montipora capricornis]|uniref:neuropeptide FF receptor 2-like isoform X2 n=1 Tax=Montipora capricornis TaxID=246305 RepID=UPI0035F20224